MRAAAKRGCGCRFKFAAIERSLIPCRENYSHKILRYNSSLSKPSAPSMVQENFVRDVVFLLVTALFFGISILYLRACERLK